MTDRRARLAALIAWCELRDDFRQFRLDRIRPAEALGAFPVEPDKEPWVSRLYHRFRET